MGHDGRKGCSNQFPESWMTLVSSSDLINDIKVATNDQLSLHAAAKEILKPGYTMNGFNWHDQRGIEGIGFVRTLRTLLTYHLPQLTPGTRGIIEKSFAKEVGMEKTINVLALCKAVVTKISAYAFFGMDYGECLMQNPHPMQVLSFTDISSDSTKIWPIVVDDDEFIDAAYYYNEDVLYGSELLRLTPKFLVPFTGPLMKVFLKRQRIFFNGLVSIIEGRMNSPGSVEKYNDVIQWIIDTSPKSNPWTPGRMAFEIMAIWFGSVQGLATTLAFAIFSLCENPECLQVLRQEIDSEASGGVHDERRGPTLHGQLPERVLQVYPCRIRVAKGEWVGIPVGPMLRDGSMYPQPDVFDPFRFMDPKLLHRPSSVQPEGPSKFTDISDTWHVWGTGRLTCPGRFFVSYAMKHTIHYMLENYDVEMVQRSTKNTVSWRTLTLPAPGVKAHFKIRK
ncbi:cytochrome P450 [Apiospora sp. TS-2023a]